MFSIVAHLYIHIPSMCHLHGFSIQHSIGWGAIVELSLQIHDGKRRAQQGVGYLSLDSNEGLQINSSSLGTVPTMKDMILHTMMYIC